MQGRNYVSVGYGLNVSDLWRRNFIVLCGFAILFQLTQVTLIEWFPHFGGGSSVTIYAPEDSDTKKRNAALRERKEAKVARKRKGFDEKVDEDLDGGYVFDLYVRESLLTSKLARPLSSTASRSPGRKLTTMFRFPAELFASFMMSSAMSSPVR